MAVFIDGSDNDRDSLASAVKFCSALDGRLDVVHAVGREPIILPPEAIAMPDYPPVDPARTAAARQAYDEVCGKLGYTRWMQLEATPSDAIRGLGLLHDVIILERASSERGPDVLALNTALFDTAGAVLVCPPSPPATIGTSVAVVWSPTLQAARAVHAAMPLLERADEVTVLTDSSKSDADVEALVEYLGVHGIEAKSASFDGARLTARGRGRAIIAATQGKADLLVMGAYGENMLSTLLGLGRTTQKVVTATRIPTLVHH